MEKEKYFAPKFGERSFHCPQPDCGVYSHHIWNKVWNEENIGVPNLKVVYCLRCNKISIWYDEEMIFPESTGIPPPNKDLNENIKKDYLEASSILTKSPKASSALLRLCIQKLCIQLGEKGKKINDDIKKLVKKGLPTKIQKALDIVRVIGNNAVHPGEINLEDNKDVALKLFSLTNIIADTMITQPKEIEEIYDSLPDKEKEAIKKRDNSK